MTAPNSRPWVAAGLALLLLAPSALAATPLDERKIAYLKSVDRKFRVDGSGRVSPRSSDEHAYYEKALAICGLVKAGAAPSSRLREANSALRFALRAWSAANAAQMHGRTVKVWNHGNRPTAVRIYALFEQYLETDVRAAFKQRMEWLQASGPVTSSENLGVTFTSSTFLSYELAGKRNGSHGSCRTWLIERLTDMGKRGLLEEGSPYAFTTLAGVLNLAEFARDPVVRSLASLFWDHYTAQLAGFVNKGNFNSTGNRCYWFWSHGDGESWPQTQIARTLFTGNPVASGYKNFVLVAASDYRPLVSVLPLYQHSARPSEAFAFANATKNTVFGGGTFRHRIYRGRDYSISTFLSPKPLRGSHDLVGCRVRSTRSLSSQVVPYGHPVNGSGPSKMKNSVERYFGHENVAFVEHGGVTHAVAAGGGPGRPGIPIRCFYTRDFQVTLQGGWAFFNNGKTFVAWGPTQGNPVLDPASSDSRRGEYVRSTYASRGPEGEVAVIEAGDAATYGTFAAFKAEILSRNPRPRWRQQKIVYKTKTGARVRFAARSAAVNGVTWDKTSFPRAGGPGLNGFQITSSAGTTTVDFDARRLTGETARLASTIRFGTGAPAPPPPPTRTDGARLVSHTIPTTLQAGQVVNVAVVLENSGQTTWTRQPGDYRLRAVDLSDPFTAQLASRLPVGVQVAPGQQREFRFALRAPAQSGSYLTDWRMFHSAGGRVWFGEVLAVRVTVTGGAPNPTPRLDRARVLSHTIPARLRAGESRAVTITVKNAGNTTWSRAGGYRLRAVDRSDPFTTQLGLRLPSGVSVPPAATYVFRVTLTAPTTPGRYVTDWRMFKEAGRVWFGEILRVRVRVR